MEKAQMLAEIHALLEPADMESLWFVLAFLRERRAKTAGAARGKGA